MTCLACEVVGPGGVVAATPGWVVDHCIGPLGVGTLIVKPRRHVLHVGELTVSEAEELGPLLRSAAAAVTHLLQPDQVYVCLWSHAERRPGHIHFVVQPVSHGLVEGFDLHGPALQAAMFDRGEPLDTAAAADFAAAAREWLAWNS